MLACVVKTRDIKRYLSQYNPKFMYAIWNLIHLKMYKNKIENLLWLDSKSEQAPTPKATSGGWNRIRSRRQKLNEVEACWFSRAISDASHVLAEMAAFIFLTLLAKTTAEIISIYSRKYCFANSFYFALKRTILFCLSGFKGYSRKDPIRNTMSLSFKFLARFIHPRKHLKHFILMYFHQQIQHILFNTLTVRISSSVSKLIHSLPCPLGYEQLFFFLSIQNNNER